MIIMKALGTKDARKDPYLNLTRSSFPYPNHSLSFFSVFSRRQKAQKYTFRKFISYNWPTMTESQKANAFPLPSLEEPMLTAKTNKDSPSDVFCVYDRLVLSQQKSGPLEVTHIWVSLRPMTKNTWISLSFLKGSGEADWTDVSETGTYSLNDWAVA